MHKVSIPQWLTERVKALRGKVHAFDDLRPETTALVVIDLQNGFMMEGVAHSLLPEAREIVPNVNRIAAALRAAGGLVVWVKNTETDESHQSWSVFYDNLSTAERRSKRGSAMRDGSLGHQLWAELDTGPDDLVVHKTRYSAFIQGSSDLEQQLRKRAIDTVVVTGTSTAVCCESTARDAMMRNFKTIMVSDANAAASDEQHNAALAAFYRNFGDVMSTDELLAYIARNAASALRSTGT
jgi:ureidoacrylate peracid hydrolase